MAKALKAADRLTWDSGAYPTSCPMPAQTGVQKIMMIDMACEHVTDTFFFIHCYIKSKYNFYFSMAVYEEAPPQEQQMVNSKY
jgi:hypothetical protein